MKKKLKRNWKAAVALIMALLMVLTSGIVVTNQNLRAGDTGAQEQVTESTELQAQEETEAFTGETETAALIEQEGGAPAEGEKSAEETAPETQLSYPPQTFRMTAEGTTITVEVAAPEGALPEGTEMRAEKVEKPVPAVEGKTVKGFVSIDVSFWYNGAEIEPQKEVKVTFSRVNFPGQNVTVKHIKDDGTEDTLVDNEKNASTIDVDVPSFSEFDFYFTDEGEETTSTTEPTTEPETKAPVDADITLQVGETKETPQGAGNRTSDHKWESSDTKVATVSGKWGNERIGEITGKSAGTATVKHYVKEYTSPVKSTWVEKESYTVVVEAPEETVPEGATEYTIMVDEKLDLTGTGGNYSSTKEHKWKSSKDSIATVAAKTDGNKATVTGVKEGTTTVTHTFKGKKGGSYKDYTDTFIIHVIPSYTPADDFTVSMEYIDGQKTKNLEADEKVQYLITVMNTGSTELTNIVVSQTLGAEVKPDTKTPARYTVNEDGTVTIRSLYAKGFIVLQSKYTVTSEDVTAGATLSNTASGTITDGKKTYTNTSETLTATVINAAKAFDISKALSAGQKEKDWDAGEDVYFDIFVRNLSAEDFISNIQVQENLSGAIILPDDAGSYIVNEDGTATIENIAPGDYVTIKAKYTVTQDDIKAKKRVDNTASANYKGAVKTSNAASIIPKTIDKLEVYVYMKIGNFSDAAKQALGIKDMVTNKYDYAPVGVLTVDSSFITEANPAYPSDWATKQYAMLRSSDDWARFYSSIISFSPYGMVDTDGYNYSKNNGNPITVEMIRLAKQDTEQKSGSNNTALFTQDSATMTTEYGFDKNTKKVHLDCVFETVKVNFVDENGKAVVDKSKKTLSNLDYIKGQHVGEPDLETSEESVYEYYRSDGTKWNFVTDTVVEPTTTITVKLAKKHGAIDVAKTIANAHQTGVPFKYGDTVYFNIKVQNRGNYTLNNVTVEDTLPGAEIIAGPDYTIKDGKAIISKLYPGDAPDYYGQSVTVKAKYVIQKTDVGKTLTNTAAATPVNGPSGTDTAEVEVEKEKPPITITASSSSWMYDGKKHTDSGYTFNEEALEPGDELSAVVKGEITDAGTTQNVVESYRIMRGTIDVTSLYTFEESIEGTLEVTPANVMLTSASAAKVYDGTPLISNEVTADGFVGTDGATFVVTGSRTDVGTGKNTFSYQLKPGTKANNYTIHQVEGDLTVTAIPTPIIIAANSGSKTYDGTALTNSGFTYTQGVLCSGDVLTAVVEGTITDAGSTANKVISYQVTRGGVDVTDNYTFGESVDGTLTVNPRNVTLTSATASKNYDGTPLTNGMVTVSGDGFAGSEGVTYTVSGSRLDVGTSSNTFTYQFKTGTKEGNYNINKVEGTLTVNPAATAIIITANSATKTYDGTPLTDAGYTYTQNVLASGDVLTATVEGTITDAGSTANVVTGYVVMRGATDVTANYTFGTSVNGTLTVNQRNVTLTSADASKAYDGTPLTNDTVTVGGDGFVEGQGAVYYVSGSQIDAGSSANTFTYDLTEGTLAENYNITTTEGTLTVTPNANTIVITAGSDSKTYDGTPLTNSSYTYTEGVLAAGDVLTATVAGTITNAGTAANNVTSYKVMRNGVDVTGNYTFGESIPGTLTVNPKAVTLTSASDSKVYDGTALTNGKVTAEGFVGSDGAAYSVTGTQTNAGSSANTFTYTLNKGTKAANYTITKKEGTLTVSKIATPIVITANSGSKTYDGTPLENSGYTYTQNVLAAGDTLTATVEGSITDAGSTENMVTSYRVMRGTTDVTENYTFGESVNGTLTVNPKAVTLTSATASKTYDGTALTNDTVTAVGFVGEDGATYDVTGSQLDAGSSDNTFTYFLNEGVNADNYTITPVYGTLTVNKIAAAITIKANSDSKMYDGTPLTNAGYTYTQGILVAGDELSAAVEGTITDAGSEANVVSGYVVMRGETDVTANYTFGASENGTLTISKRSVVMTSANAEKVYDGTPLTNANVAVTGDGFIEGQGASYNVTGSRTSVGTSNNTFTYELNEGTNANNYIIETHEGRLTVKRDERTITITAASDSKTYDGTPLENSGYTYTQGILVQGDVLSATVVGSITDAGTAVNEVTSYVVMRGDVDVTDNYNFEESVAGILAVNPRPVTLTSGSAERTYNGTALTNETVTVGGDGFVEGEGAVYDVKGSQTDVGSSTNTFTYELNEGTNPDNYAIDMEFGTLTVNRVTTPITITAASDGKMYDGAALTNSGYTYTEGVLMDGDVLTATVAGTITDAGSAANVVTGYVVMRGDVNVTNNYTFADSVNGTLTVNKRNITLTSATDSKVYDGTPLTNTNVAVTGDGFAKGEGASYNVTGTRTVVGESSNTFTYSLNDNTNAGNYTITPVEGKLTITKITDEINITAASDSKKYDGTTLENSGYDVTGSVVEGDRLVVEVTGSITDAGTAVNRVSSYKVMRGAVDVTANYTFGTITNGTLEVTKRVVTLTSADASKPYDGTALTNNEVTVGGDGFAEGEGAAYDVTGSQLDVGTGDNTFTYTLNEGTKAANYEITKTEGKLTITPNTNTIVITAASGSKTYDGTALTNNGYTYTEGVLAEGDELTAVVEGTITNAGSTANVVTSYKVMRGTQEVTGNYTFGESVNGTLTVNKRNVTLTSATDSKTYDGTALTNDTITVGGDGFAEGEGAAYNVSGTQTYVGSSINTFTYTLNESTKADNYNITKTEGTLTVNKKTTPIVITANSGSKTYDGAALADAGFTYTEGVLADGDVLTAVVEGTITNVGSTANQVVSYTVTRDGADVTANYTFGTSVNGTLTVNKRNVTLISATDSKTYDGTPLTNSTVTVGGDGFAYGEGAAYDVTGSRTNVGTGKNTFGYTLNAGTLADNYSITKVEGDLTINKIETPIIITAGSDSKMYDGTALTNDSFTYTEDVLADGDVLTAVISGTITDAGTAANKVASYQVLRNGENVTANYTFGDSVDGTLEVTKRDVILTSATETKAYDGTPLTNAEVTVSGSGFAEGEGAAYDVTGSQLDVGNTKNTFTYTLSGNTKAGNYSITKEEGTLTVTKNAEVIIITAASDTKKYDGTALTNSSFTYTENVLAEGDVLEATIVGTITDAGETDNVVTGYRVMRGEEDVTGNYTFGDSVPGKLTVTKRDITLTSESGSKTYDGTPLTNSIVNVSGDGFAANEGASYNVTGSRTDVGTGKNTFTYELNNGTKADNYNITTVEGDLTIEKIATPIVITANSNSKTYDGTALTDNGYTYTTGVLQSGDVLTAVVEGTITNVGTTTNTVQSYKVMRGETEVTGNYTFGESVSGTLTVNKRAVTLTSATASKTYDGTALTDGTVTVGGAGFVGDEGVTYIVTGSRTDVGSSPNSFTYQVKTGTQADNYDITKVEGTLTINPITTPIIITANSASKTYDGTPLTDAGYTYTQNVLASGDVLTATVEGTITNAGSEANVVTTYAVMRGETNVTGNYTFGNSVNGTLTVNKRSVTLTSADDSKAYDGTPLMNDTVTVGGAGFAANEGAVYYVTGSQLDAGNSKNTFTYDLTEGTLAENYEIQTNEGTLTVTPNANTIVITAASDSKTYDGTPLTNNGYTYTQGVLIAGDVLTATVEGTITDAGTTANTVASYKVMRGTTDVTSNYTFGDSIDGTLTVNKKAVTLTSASDSKVYDGSPLTNGAVTAEGFVGNEGASYDVTGSQLDAGSSANAFTYTLNEGTKADNYTITQVEGTLTVSKITTPITITAASDSKTYDGAALTNSSYTYTEGVLVAGDVLTATVEGTITNAGSAANVVAGYAVMRGDTNVTENYTFAESVSGTLTVNPKAVTLTSASDSKTYDGTPLTNETVTATGFVGTDGAAYTVTGSQLDAGSSENTFTYELNEGVIADNYTITPVYGTLTVNKIAAVITIKANSDSKMYDGTELTNAGYTFTQNILVAGDELTATVEGSITDAGNTTNVVTSYAVMRGETNVTDNYTFGASENGTLTVSKRSVVMTSATDEKVYDGTPLTNANVAVTGDGFIEGQGAAYNVTGSRTSVGTSDNTFTYTLNEGTNANNYTITPVFGTLTIRRDENSITITAASDSKMYDGTPLTNNGYTYTQGVLVPGDVLTAVVEGTITDAGTQANVVTSYVVMRGEEDVTENYNFEASVPGTLTVTKRAVTLTSGNAARTYNGLPLTNNEVTVTGDGFASGEGAVYDVTGSRTDVGTSTNTFTYELNEGTKAANYTITPAYGTLTVNKITTPITITAASGSKLYDGEALTNSGYTFTEGVLMNGDVLTATVAGSITDAGTTANEVTGYVVMRGAVDVTSNYTFADSVNGTLTVEKRNVTLTSATDSKVYDGTALTNSLVTVSGDGFASGEGAAYNVTGSRLDVGSINNTFTYELNDGTKAGNYNITPVEGTLTITPITAEITVTAKSGRKMYDGTSLTNSGYDVTGSVVAGDRLEVVVEGTITNAGTTANRVTSYKVMRGTQDVSSNYTFGAITDGTLEVTKRNVTLTSATKSKAYDGTALTDHTVTVGGDGFANGEGAAYNVTGSQLDVGSGNNTFTYTLDEGTNAGNYDITTTEGTLTVTPNENTIVITAASDSKKYDGNALTNNGYTYTENVLAQGDVLTAVIEGSITDAGTAANTVTSYKVMRGAQDVTDNYTFGESIDGVLTISKRNVTLTSATQSKTYDGTPLTDEEVTVGGDGFVTGQGASYDVTGSRLDAGTSNNTFTYALNEGTNADNYNITKAEGTLTVHKKTTPIVVTAGSNSKTYDGTALTEEGFTFTEGVLAEGDVLNAVVEGTITNVGTAANKVTAYAVTRDGVDVTGNYTFGASVDGTLTVNKRTVTLTSATDSKTYDGTPLSNAEVSIGGEGFAEGEGAAFHVTGSITNTGTIKNTFTYALNEGTLANNYNITKTEGDLTINKIETPIIITADSDEKMYDGTALTKDSFTYTEGVLVDGDVLSAVISGSRTDFGTTANKVASYQVLRNGADVTANYTFGTSVDGTLEITKRDVILTSASGSKAYDGTPLTNAEVTVSGSGFAEGEGAAYNVTGSRLDVGNSKNTFTYYLNGNTKAENYDITKVEGTLTITQNETTIVITAASDTKMYDGEALTNSTFTYTENVLAEGDVLEATVEGTITDVGEADNVVTGYRVMRGEEDVTANYTFGESVDGILTVTKRNVTLTSATASKTYDGTALTNNEVSITGDGFAEGEGAAYNVTGSRLDVGSSKNTFTYTLNNGTKAGNYNITTAEGDLTIEKITTPIVITADSGSKTYDGNALTKNSFTYTQDVLVRGDVLEATVEGSITDFGTTDNVVTAYKVMRGETDVTANYTFATSVNGTLEITKRDVTLQSASANKTYDGTPLTRNMVTIAAGSFAPGEGFDYSTTGSQLNAGTSENTFTYTLTGNAKAENYNVTEVNGTLTVNPVATTVTVKISGTKEQAVYDGEEHTSGGYTVTEISNPLFKETDIQFNGTASVTGTNAGTYPMNLKSEDFENLSQNFTNIRFVIDDGEMVIDKRPVTIQVQNSGKVYGTPDPDPVTTGIITGGLIDEGDLGTITFRRTNLMEIVGTYERVLAADYTSNDNYAVTVEPGNFTITKSDELRPILTPFEGTYDGQPHTIGVSANVTEGTTFTYSIDGGVTWLDTLPTWTNAVDGQEIMVKASNPNYEDRVATATITIDAKEISITVDPASKTYGEEDPVFTGKVEGLVHEEDLGEIAFIRTNPEENGAGTYEGVITAVYTENPNYKVNVVPADFTIEKATMTVEVDSFQGTYDGEEHKPVVKPDVTEGTTITYSTDGGRTWTETAPTITDAGKMEYLVKVENPNYEDVIQEATLEVTKKKVSITVDPASKVYGEDDPVFTGTVEGLVDEGDLGEVTFRRTNPGQNDAGTYPGVIRADYTSNGNYDVEVIPGDFTIEKSEAMEVIVTPFEGEYDGKEHTVTVETNIEEGTTIYYSTDEGKTWTTEPPTWKDVTEPQTVYVKAENPNYKDVVVEKTVTILPRTITIESISASKQYDGTPLTTPEGTRPLKMTGTFADGEGDDVTFKMTGSQTEVGSSENTFELSATTTNLNNYNIIKIYGTLTVEAIPVPTGPFTLTIHYVDGAGNLLAPDYVNSYPVGAAFRIVSPTIDGYTPNYGYIENPEGGMPAQDLEVTVVYTTNGAAAPGGRIIVRPGAGVELLRIPNINPPLDNKLVNFEACNFLTLLFVLAAMILIAFYTKDAKKYQKKRQELLREKDNIEKKM